MRGSDEQPGWMFKTREGADKFAEWARGEMAPRADMTAAEAAGTVDVTVTTPAGSSATSMADRFQFTPPGTYNSLAPTRVLDTRTGSPLGPGGSLNLQLAGTRVPSNATSVVMNLTATSTTATSWLTVYPTGSQQPTASNLNWGASQTVANLVEVKPTLFSALVGRSPSTTPTATRT